MVENLTPNSVAEVILGWLGISHANESMAPSAKNAYNQTLAKAVRQKMKKWATHGIILDTLRGGAARPWRMGPVGPRGPVTVTGEERVCHMGTVY